MSKTMESRPYSPPLAPDGGWLAELAFTGIVLLIVVTLTPFKVYNAYAVAVETSGDIARQIALLLCLGLALADVLRARNAFQYLAIPLSILLLFTWLLVTLLWSQVPDIALRRAGSVLVLSFAALLSAARIGGEKAASIIYKIVSVVLILDVISVLVLPNARHLASEANLDLVGNWRGMHTHKNNAATIAVLGLMLSIRNWYKGSSRYAPFVFFVSLLFLWGTHSATSAIFGIVSSLTMVAYLYGRKRGFLKRHIFACIFFITVIVICISMIFSDNLVQKFSDPKSFTGRVAIWKILTTYSSQNLFTGSGFGSFWLVGYKSPAMLISREWAGMSAPHGHSGYLDILASMGVPGLILSVWAFCLTPVVLIVRARFMEPTLKAFCIGWFVYSAGNNFLETSWLAATNAIWTTWLFCIAFTAMEVRRISAGGVSRA